MKKLSSFVQTINMFAPEFAHLTNEQLLARQIEMGLPRTVIVECDGKRHFQVANGEIFAWRDCDC